VGADGVDINLNSEWEVYGVRNKVWKAADRKADAYVSAVSKDALAAS
jgi:hypothetical protein